MNFNLKATDFIIIKALNKHTVKDLEMVAGVGKPVLKRQSDLVGQLSVSFKIMTYVTKSLFQELKINFQKYACSHFYRQGQILT